MKYENYQSSQCTQTLAFPLCFSRLLLMATYPSLPTASIFLAVCRDQIRCSSCMNGDASRPTIIVVVVIVRKTDSLVGSRGLLHEYASLEDNCAIEGEQ